MSLEDRIRTLEDREALRELQYRYGYRLDERDWDGWGALFTEDATGEFEGWGTAEGREEITQFGREVVGGHFEYTAHVTHQPLVDIDENGQTATGSRYLEVYYVLRDGTAAWRQGRYEDTFRREDGEWRFTSVSNTFLARHQWRPPQEGPGIEDLDGYGEMVNVE